MTTPTTVQVRLQIRADTAANWTSVNPVLLANELGLESDTKKFKIGNGSTAWSGLAYFPSIVSGGTVLGNLEIGTTGTLTFEGSTADGFETTLGVVDPTADRTILLPNQSGTVVVGGNASITNADIAANAEIAVSKLADGAARQLLQTDAAGTGVEWTDNVDIPGTLDVTGAATFDAAVTVAGDLTVNGTTTTISTQNLLVEDKNIIIGDVATPTDTTADGGGITLKGATDKTINWVDSTDAWTSSERFSVPLGSASAPSLTFTGDENTGIYTPGADQVAISTNGTKRIEIQADGDIDIDNGGVFYDATNNRLAIGSNNPQSLLHLETDGTALRIVRGSSTGFLYNTGTSSTATTRLQGNDGPVELYTNASQPIVFSANTSERARIDSSGRLLVGTSSTSAASRAVLQGNSYDSSGGCILKLARGNNSPNSGGDLGNIEFTDSGHSFAASISAKRDGGTWTSGSSQPTRLEFSTTADGASSPTERMRIHSNGDVGIGLTGQYPGDNNTTNGVYFEGNGKGFFSRSAAVSLLVNRNTDDGNLVEFRQAGTLEGTISVSGTTVSYNGAHLSRWSQLPSGQERIEILRGSVLSNIDEMCEWGDEENEQLNRMKVSNVEGDKNVSGVFQAWDDDDDTYTNDFYCAMTGDFIIRIGAGVTVERGDLLMSAGDGTAKPQEDDIIRSKTIAKVTSTNVSCTYPDGSYCVPCVLMAC